MALSWMKMLTLVSRLKELAKYTDRTNRNLHHTGHGVRSRQLLTRVKFDNHSAVQEFQTSFPAYRAIN